MSHWFHAVALDYDGTIADHGVVDAGALGAIHDLRAQGRAVILCTGRILSALQAEFADYAAHFDAVVAENGAVVQLRGRDPSTVVPALPGELRARLLERDVPLRCGDVVLATSAAFAPLVLAAIAELGLDAQLVRNRSELMILPPGVSKATGLLEVLAELRISRHNTLAVGDAENDRALLQACGLGIAGAGAVPALRQQADACLGWHESHSTAAFLRHLVLYEDTLPVPLRWQVQLGTTRGAPVTMHAVPASVLVTGTSGSGKSYVAGQLVERLCALGYVVCVFDCEGDHAELGQLRSVLHLGGAEPLPPPGTLPKLIRHRFTSVVLDLSALPIGDKRAYVHAALAELAILRREGGLPHWIVLEEADQVLPQDDTPGASMDSHSGWCVVTHRSGALPTAIREAVGAVIALTGAERVATAFAGAPREPMLPLAPGEALLAFPGRVRRYRVMALTASRVRHRQRYTWVQLRPERRFYFGGRGHPARTVAGNLVEFADHVAHVDEGVLRQHLHAGDFSRWVGDVLTDDHLASRLRAIERWVRIEHDLDSLQVREAVISAVEARYPDAVRHDDDASRPAPVSAAP